MFKKILFLKNDFLSLISLSQIYSYWDGKIKVRYPCDIHNLNGCKLARFNMTTPNISALWRCVLAHKNFPLREYTCFQGLPEQITTDWVAEKRKKRKKKKFILSQFWKPQVWNPSAITVVSSRGSEGEPVACLPSSYWRLLSFLGVPWLINSSLQSLRLSSHDLLPCVCVFSPILIGHQSYWIRAHPNWVWPHLNLITSAKTLF